MGLLKVKMDFKEVVGFFEERGFKQKGVFDLGGEEVINFYNDKLGEGLNLTLEFY